MEQSVVSVIRIEVGRKFAPDLRKGASVPTAHLRLQTWRLSPQVHRNVLEPSTERWAGPRRGSGSATVVDWGQKLGVAILAARAESKARSKSRCISQYRGRYVILLCSC